MTARRPSTDPFDLSGRVGVITGGAGNLAFAFATALGSAGARVVLIDTNEPALKRRAAELEHLGVSPLSLVGDVGDPHDVASCFERASQETGEIDILVNNAATKSPHFMTDLEGLPFGEWETVLRVDLGGVFLCAQAAVRHMRRRGGTIRGGTIVNIASIYGVVAPDPRIYEGSTLNTPPVYPAAKGGVIALTRYIAAYYGNRGIRCNCVTPGGVAAGQDDKFVRRYSERVPLGRMARPDEIAMAVLYLASDASSYVTGHNLVVDGGLTAW